MTRIRFLLFTVSLIIIDQLSKYIVRHSGGFYICNPGIAFGIQIPEVLIWTVYAIIISLVIFYWLKNFKSQILNLKHAKQNFLENLKIENWGLIENCKLKIVNSLPIILILSGALSNLLDRLLYGCVIDFIDLKFWPVFNSADTFITIGGIMIIISKIKNQRSKI